ncbi:MAG: substrate-binding domain-containing protein, partial [Spirochaetia bacterium]|nr:substrate-binding domain-containing protein [Spirochaetia bacterium]
HYAYRESARRFFQNAHEKKFRKIVCVFPGMGDNYVQADLWNIFEKSPLHLKGKGGAQKIGPENPERDESRKLLYRNIPHIFPRELVAAHIKKHGVPELFFCPDEYQAVGTYLALQDMGIKVPGECGIAAFTDNVYSMTHLGIRFSGFVQDQEMIGTRLADALLFRLGHPDAAPAETFIESSWQTGDTLQSQLHL